MICTQNCIDSICLRFSFRQSLLGIMITIATYSLLAKLEVSHAVQNGLFCKFVVVAVVVVVAIEFRHHAQSLI